ncbi:hypothetical protein CRUP_025088, partial [Coryphaenoides rupestris]
MRLHQAVTLSPGKILYRDVSCMCSATGNLECDCQKTKRFSFNPTDDHTEDPIHSTPDEVQWHSPEVVGKWCALVYDHAIYPGIIQDVNETHCQDLLLQDGGVGGQQLLPESFGQVGFGKFGSGLVMENTGTMQAKKGNTRNI